jgi:hypothetical protein
MNKTSGRSMPPLGGPVSRRRFRQLEGCGWVKSVKLEIEKRDHPTWNRTTSLSPNIFKLKQIKDAHLAPSGALCHTRLASKDWTTENIQLDAGVMPGALEKICEWREK